MPYPYLQNGIYTIKFANGTVVTKTVTDDVSRALTQDYIYAYASAEPAQQPQFVGWSDF